MTIIEAAQASAKGITVVSNVGRRYTPDQLAVKWVGAHMTEAERKGAWFVARADETTV